MLSLEQIEGVIMENSYEAKNVSELKAIVKAAARAGICPECGKKLMLINVRWHLAGPRGRDATVACPNNHNLDFNTRTRTEPEGCGYIDMNLHKPGNGLWKNSQNIEINTLYHKLCSWISD